MPERAAATNMETNRTTGGCKPRDASPRRRAPIVWILAPLALYIAALNPFFLPGSFDNIIYYYGALSLVEHGSFTFRGLHIVDWPPGVSAMLAVPFLLGLQSIWVAKACIVLSAAAALVLAYRLFIRENRGYPVLTLALFALLPTSFLMGTRIMGEWPYFLMSVLFLVALRQLRSQEARRPGDSPSSDLAMAVAVGLLLGAAALTKYTGVLLGAAVVAQAVEKWRRSEERLPWRAVLPESIVAGVGAAVGALWQLRIQWHASLGAAHVSDYYSSGWLPDQLGAVNLFTVPGKITDLFFHSEAVLPRIGLDGWAVAVLCAIPGIIVLTGMVRRLLSSDRSPSDWYVLTVLALFVAMAQNQQTRYLMPVAPFLIGYGILGCAYLSSVVRVPAGGSLAAAGIGRLFAAPVPVRAGVKSPRISGRVCAVAVALWIVALSGASIQLILLGNPAGTHRGLSYAVSPAAEDLYKGFWLDLYQASNYAREHSAPGRIAVIGGEDKYVTAFSGRNWIAFEDAEDFAFLLIVDGTELPGEQMTFWNLRPVRQSGSIALYLRDDSDRDLTEARRSPAACAHSGIEGESGEGEPAVQAVPQSVEPFSMRSGSSGSDQLGEDE